MADDDPMVGTICWRDLTVRDAKDLAEFYRQVVGWETRAVEQSIGDTARSLIALGVVKP